MNYTCGHFDDITHDFSDRNELIVTVLSGDSSVSANP
jgi:hypothetical protein